MSKYTVTAPLTLDLWGADGFDVEAVITYSVTPYRAATQIDPEEPASVEDISIKLCDAKTKAELSLDQILERFSEDDSLKSWLMEEADEREAYALDCKADADREERGLGLS